MGAIDANIKALLETQFNQLSERLDVMNRDLKRSNELCEQLVSDNIMLKKQLGEANAEIDRLKLYQAASTSEVADEIAKVRKESADAIKAAVVKSSARINGLAIQLDDLEQYGRRKSIRVQNVPVVPGEREYISLILAQINNKILPTGIVLREKDCIRYHRSSKEKENLDRGVGET